MFSYYSVSTVVEKASSGFKAHMTLHVEELAYKVHRFSHHKTDYIDKLLYHTKVTIAYSQCAHFKS